ncbi:MAG: MMPL family transporter [Caldisericia bacterium]|jgi:predicted RND superfamily exporter protein|nr:MMPL family transporter [Caldisericia bacterium]
MKSIFRFIVKNRLIIFIVFIILIVISLFYFRNVKITYDIFKLLPKDIDSIKGIEILNKEFSRGANLTILIKTDKIEELEKTIFEIESLPFVESINSIKDYTDISLPEEFWKEEVKSWYKDGYFRIEVALKKSENYSSQIASLRKVLPENASLTGSEVISEELRESFKGTTERYFLIGVILVLIFLLFTFPTIFGPIFILISMVTGVLINIGISGFLKTEIYFLAFTIVSILQLAVTLDYSLFLYHRYIEERKKFEKEEAMEEALLKTFKPILLSGLTTIAGFYALTFGRITIFSEAGWILVRGVSLSLLSTFLFLPSLLVIFDKFAIGGEHKIFTFKLEKLGKFLSKYSFVFTLIFIFIIIFSYFGSNRINLIYDLKNFYPKDLKSIEVLNKINEIFGEKEVLYLVSNRENNNFLNLLSKIKNLDGVNEIVHYSTILDPLIPQEFISEEIFKKFLSENYELAIIYSKYKIDEREGESLRKEIENLIKINGLYDTYLTGDSLFLSDLKKIAMEDQTKTTKLSFIFIIILIFLGFLSLIVPLILIFIVKGAIWTNIAYYILIGISSPFFIPTMLNTIQLGATIDYSVLVYSRYEEERRKGLNINESVIESVKWSSNSLITSAGTMILMTLPAAILSKIPLVNFTMGSLGRGAFLSLIFSLIFLPSISKSLDKLTQKLSILRR